MWRFMDAESPAKEISESYAAFANLKKVCMIHNYNWLHIGDGTYTRTAAIFAFFSKSHNWSIDPCLNLEKFEEWEDRFNVRNIYPFKMKFEEFNLDNSIRRPYHACDVQFELGYPYSICCVHAHVNLEEVHQQYPNWHYLYTNACCFPAKQTFSKKFMEDNGIIEILRKEDLGILCHLRDVRIYKNLKHE